jgi:hypothetical protein
LLFWRHHHAGAGTSYLKRPESEPIRVWSSPPAQSFGPVHPHSRSARDNLPGPARRGASGAGRNRRFEVWSTHGGTEPAEAARGGERHGARGGGTEPAEAARSPRTSGRRQGACRRISG